MKFYGNFFICLYCENLHSLVQLNIPKLVQKEVSSTDFFNFEQALIYHQQRIRATGVVNQLKSEKLPELSK